MGIPCPSLVWCSLEDHGAVLPVEGKIGNVDGAGAAVDGRGQPVDATIRGHQYIGVESDFKRPIDAGGEKGGLSLKPCPGGSCHPLCRVMSTLPCHLLVLQDNIGQPDHGGGHPQQLDVVVFLGVPPQAIIGPLLWEGEQRTGVTVLPEAGELVSCLSCSSP